MVDLSPWPGDPLTEQWPGLATIPRVGLVRAPTPVQRLDDVSRWFRSAPLLFKRDDECTPWFGGCKVRGLDFGLGAALSTGADTILTSGTAGSHHVAATAVFARRLGLAMRAVVLPQPDGELVRRNLLIAGTAGAELVPVPHGVSLRLTGEVMHEQMRALRDAGRVPFVLPFGGSDPRTGIGQVSAVVELSRQLRDADAALPARVYVAAASLTTAAAVAVGLRLAGMRCTVVAVQVAGEPTGTGTAASLLHRASQVVAALRAVDASVPAMEIAASDVEIRDGRADGPFGEPTPQSAYAAGVAAGAGIQLDECYTAKAFAVCLNDAVERGPGSAPLLFWHTGNSRPVPGGLTGDVDLAGNVSLTPPRSQLLSGRVRSSSGTTEHRKRRLASDEDSKGT